MIDTYLCSLALDGLLAFCGAFENVIGPVTGIPVREEGTDEFGGAVPAQEAVGDPSLWYACVRSREEFGVPEGIDIVERELGEKIVGVWA